MGRQELDPTDTIHDEHDPTIIREADHRRNQTENMTRRHLIHPYGLHCCVHDRLSSEEDTSLVQRATPISAESRTTSPRCDGCGRTSSPRLRVMRRVSSRRRSPGGQFTLHQWCLAAVGMPIGEYFDLERLVDYWREKGRRSSFLSSASQSGLSLFEDLDKWADIGV
ncbi:uncharacterized protein ATNIH1004_009787 [Aspergillus tanneri]|uniref:Uncharacterized protein n=1 Tax=Aspergillus tanneri TaxID=1220188 RepID=A0A5M9M7K8_9EURO|nr:uncharacterized protein ATNIH1004_009787 [Aspergillus tanneri]KAA8643025.1 hypothetical protein ATNIH1004_009787 [Aspergillus tanneri]